MGARRRYRNQDRLFWFWSKYSPPFFGNWGYNFLRGFFSGYPICCIAYFNSYAFTEEWGDYVKRFACHGYVPCPRCIKEMKKRGIPFKNHQRVYSHLYLERSKVPK